MWKSSDKSPGRVKRPGEKSGDHVKHLLEMLSQRKVMFGLSAACLLAVAAGVYLGRISKPTAANLESTRFTETSRSADSIPDAFVGAGSGHFNLSFPGPATDDWDRRWRELMLSPDSPERTRQLVALLERLAETDPERAIAFADKATADAYLRADLFQAALRGWASGNPEAASTWALSQTMIDGGQAMSAVFVGAARNPADAERLAEKLSRDDPAHAPDYGSYLVAALGRVGEYGQAADFAANGPVDSRLNWLNAAFGRWAEQHPDEAVAYARQLSDPDAQRTALAAAISGWSRTDPQGVADYALTLPEENERMYALTEALHIWSEGDVADAATWLTQFGPSPELDSSVAEIATESRTLDQPAVAITWAESITDPQLCSRTLVTVLETWAGSDINAVRNYVETSPYLLAEDRADLLANIGQLASKD